MQSTDGAGVAPEEIDALGSELDEVDETEIDEGQGTETETGEDGEGRADDDAQEEEREVAEPPQRSRRAGRSERLRQELRDRDERIDRLSRDLEAVRAGVQQPRLDPAAQARAEQAEREHVRTLPYEEQIEYWRQRDRREFVGYMQGEQLRVQDQIDKAAWDARAGIDPYVAGYTHRVEQELQRNRAEGRNPRRDVVLRYLIGDDVLARRASNVPAQRRAASRRIAAQTTRPAGSRGDGTRSNTRVRDDDEALLRGITVSDF